MGNTTETIWTDPLDSRWDADANPQGVTLLTWETGIAFPVSIHFQPGVNEPQKPLRVFAGVPNASKRVGTSDHCGCQLLLTDILRWWCRGKPRSPAGSMSWCRTSQLHPMDDLGV